MKGLSVSRALRHFGFRQTIRGALILGVLGGIMMGSYGTVIVKTYPTQHERDQLVQMLKTTPAVNFLAGEIENAGTPASYAIYKSLPMMTIITAIWGLMVATRLLRGNEEDGRLELIASGAVTRRRATMELLRGYGCSILVSILVMWIVVSLLGMAPHVDLSVAEGFYMTLAVFLPGVVFAGLGVVTSQLTLTRGRAVTYGLVPLLILYCIRGVANTSDQLNWLKQLSPFGWSDLMNAVLNPQAVWIVPSVIFAGLFAAAGLYWSGKRDYGTSLLPQRQEFRSNFRLLSSPLAFVVRQKRWTFMWWLIGSVAFVCFMTALAGMVSGLLHDNEALHKFVTVSADQIKLVFVGSSFMILGLILFAMTIVEVSSIRREEAKSYLDNLLVQPVERYAWLTQRIMMIVGMVVVIGLVATFAIWQVAHMQQIDLQFGSALASGIGVLGGVGLILGIGAALYGLWPRLALIGMSVIVAWAFVIDIVRSIFHLDSWIERTSVLYYIPADPSKPPEWSGVWWLLGLGLALSVAGVLAFKRRDIETE